jgi:MFS family permease
MFFLGSVADRKGIRKTLLMAFSLLLAGRILISAAPELFAPAGMWSPLHVLTMVGILFVVTGYGMYQPAAYAGVRKFTSAKTAGMAYAMLYALMNLGGWLPSFFSGVRHSVGISGAYWIYTSLTLVALIATALILTRGVERDAAARAERERAAENQSKGPEPNAPTAETEQPAAKTEPSQDQRNVPVHLWLTVALIVAAVYYLPRPVNWVVWLTLAAVVLFMVSIRRDWGTAAYGWLANHPLANGKFFFFIFALIPVQTLFTYNWLILPQYLERAFEGGFVSDRFELFANLNPILIFILVPIVTAVTQKKKVYNMMIVGTFVMAAPAFFLAIETSIYTLLAYLLIMTVGEAMWQPRFLQYAAEIAPEGRTGAYMGVAQFPWFLTKVLVPLYSGHILQRYCPAEPPRNPEFMWLIFACIAMVSTVLLIVAKNRIGKDFKTKA